MTSSFTRFGTRLIGLILVAVALQGAFGGSAYAQVGSYSANGSTSQQSDIQVHQVDKALEWMKSQQQPDGSFAGFGAGSTVDAVLAVEAAGWDVSTYTKGGKTPVDFLEGKAAEIAKTPGGAGKLLIAVAALGRDGRSFGGVNLLDAIGANYPASGHYGSDVIGHAFAMLGLGAAGQTIPPKAVQYLESTQSSDGGWAFAGDTKPGAADTNTTAVAVQALVAGGVAESDPVMQKAKQYLLSQQNASDGGFPYQKGGEGGSDSDVNSTAYVAQAMHYLGEPNSGLSFIMSMQKADGAFKWKASEPDDNAGATYQAIPAVLGATLVSPKGTSSQMGSASGGMPGMPRTGSGEMPSGMTIVAVLTMLMLCMGVVLRRKSAIRW